MVPSFTRRQNPLDLSHRLFRVGQMLQHLGAEDGGESVALQGQRFGITQRQMRLGGILPGLGHVPGVDIESHRGRQHMSQKQAGAGSHIQRPSWHGMLAKQPLHHPLSIAVKDGFQPPKMITNVNPVVRLDVGIVGLRFQREPVLLVDDRRL
jgi:hypothetical protein